jgi:membrane-bound inhibitor of C-type lysozyme
MQLWWVAAGTALALAGCAAQPKNDPEIRDVSTVHFACDDGTTLGVWFEPDSAIITETGGETLILPQQRAGSGIWYADQQAEFRGKGNDATWTRDGRAATQCRVSDPKPAT